MSRKKGVVLTVLRWLRWHLAKSRLAAGRGIRPPAYVRTSRKRHRDRAEGFPANVSGYERLASVWDSYAWWFVPAYASFLASAGDYYRQPIKTVLDLACGTGLVTRKLAQRAELVVGLDASEAMLREARARTKVNNVRYVRADFRDFHLGQTFDAVMCGSDSLNYVEAPGEVTKVFVCVCGHLRPRGLFAFDVLDDKAFRKMASAKVVVKMGDEVFVSYYFYDPDSRVSESRVVFQDAVERHRRIPIEEEVVQQAAREAGLVVVDHFANSGHILPFLPFQYARQFYVLRKP